ncbi:hypothetical protein JCM18382A_26270 [Bradyrhizobium sp. 17-4]|jgi:4-aminobutyrate aminotransferase-like enzyme
MPAAVGLKVIEIILRDRLVERARIAGVHPRRRIREHVAETVGWVALRSTQTYAL